jgi:hypothetical protein
MITSSKVCYQYNILPQKKQAQFHFLLHFFVGFPFLYALFSTRFPRMLPDLKNLGPKIKKGKNEVAQKVKKTVGFL